jgi:hypothetical protein
MNEKLRLQFIVPLRNGTINPGKCLCGQNGKTKPHVAFLLQTSE